MIVEANTNIFEGRHFWVYYPAPSEAMRFAIAAERTRRGGPATYFSGSVGAIFGKVEGNASFRNLNIDYIQSCFILRESPVLSRSLVSKHGGWRQHLLNRIFKEGPAQGIKKISFAPKSKIQKDIFEEIAKKNGCKIGLGLNELDEPKITATLKEK
jgi:hypothetical protein